MRETHCAQILKYMHERGGITGREAFDHIGCYRLSGRIHDLRKRGYGIKTDYMYKITNGTVTRYARYVLEETPNE